MSPANFLKADFPDAVVIDDVDFAGPSRFHNRELSWLGFNWRVLEEAENTRVPLLERLRFLSISATNLDEFYTVRVAGLRELAHAGNTTPAIDGLTAAEQLVLISAEARRLMEHQQVVWEQLRAEMETAGISLLTRNGLAQSDKNYLLDVFLNDVFPVLSPLAIDPAHPFPFIPNTGFALALQMERTADKRKLQALLPIPQQIDRFVPLDVKGGVQRFLPLEELLLLHIGDLFPGYKVTGHCAFRVLRDSDLEVEDEAEDLVREFEVALKRRRRGEVIRLKLSSGAPAALRRVIMEELHIREIDVIELGGLIGMSDLQELVLDDRHDLLWPQFTPRVPERVQDHEGDMFAAIRQKDMLLHHPYETFDMVVRFLKQAAGDPDVLAIKQTLYRTSKESPIVEALCEAAEEGKSVTALVELKARFDEAANIRQSRAAGTGRRARGLRFHQLQDPCQDQHRGPARGRQADHLHPFRHRQLPSDHRAHLHRPVAFHLRCSAGARCDQGVQLRLGLRAAGCAGEPVDFAADAEIHPAGADRGRGRSCQGRQARRNLGQDELDRRAGYYRRALPCQRPRREDQPGGARHLRLAARHQGTEREHPREVDHRAVPGTQPHRLLRQRLRAAVEKGAGLHVVRRLDGPQPQPPGRDPGRDHQCHRQGADRQPDHGRQPGRRGAKLDHGARTAASAGPGWRARITRSTATASSWKTRRCPGAARQARRTCRN